MGFSISWLGFRAQEAPAVLRMLKLHITSQMDPYLDEADMSFGEMPGGWSIIFSNDPLWTTLVQDGDPWAGDSLAKRISVSREVVYVLVEEHTDVWATTFYKDGQPQWRVYRDTSADNLLHVDGQVPIEYDRFVNAAAQKAWADGWKNFDPQKGLPVAEPVQLAEAVTGFRHDKLDYDWGSPQFRVLKAGVTGS